MRPGEWTRQFLRDVRYGGRQLRRTPAFACSAILVLALGIGATAAIFALVDATLLRPLPYREPERLVKLFQRSPRAGRVAVTMADMSDWIDQTRSFAGLAGIGGAGFTTLASDGGAPEVAATQAVSQSFFDLVGVVPVAGRTFKDSDPGDARVIVIGERLWRTYFAADPAAIGRPVSLAGGPPLTIVGVVPASFMMLNRADIWTLLPRALTQGEQARRVHFLDVIGRLKPGVTIEQSRSDLQIVADRLSQSHPVTNAGWGVTIEPLQRALVGDDLRRTALVLLAGVLFLLLMACANVANLVLAKSLARVREIGVRAALGSTRPRLVRQLATESLLLAGLGGAAGLALAWMTLRIAPSLIPAGTLPTGIAPMLDWRVLLFTLVVTGAAAVFAGLIPSWQVARLPLVASLGAGSRTVAAGGGRLRTALILVQIAAALILTVGGALFVRTVAAFGRAENGFTPDHVTTLTVGLPFVRYGEAARMRRFFASVVEETRRLPGVQSAGLLSGDLPLEGNSRSQLFEVVGAPTIDPSHQPVAHFQFVDPGYFDTLGITLARGRDFGASDTETGAPVCIVNEAFARQYLQGIDPLTARLVVRSLTARVSDSVAVTRDVVGVIRQVTLRAGERDGVPEIYVPFAQNPWPTGTIVVRTANDATPVTKAIREIVARQDATLAITQVRTMDEIGAAATASPRLRAQLVATFAVSALLIAGVGLYAVLSFLARQRSSEFSVRMALGATPVNVLSLVLAHGLKLGVAGLVIGVAVAAVAVRFVSALLFGIAALDPVAFAVSAAMLLTILLVASTVPAVSAIRANPAAVLKRD